jgi:hypothetical protein
MTVSRQGLVSLGATVVPVYSHTLNLNQAITGQRSGADEYDTLQTIFGASPSFTFTGPMQPLVSAIGFECTSLTSMSISLIKFDSTTGKSASASHVLYSLAASCRAICVIDSIQCQQYGIATATVTAYFQSNDGTTHPLSKGTGSALSLAAQPTLHTLGPLDLAGTEYAGVRSFSGTLNHRITAAADTDGDQYPTLVRWFGSSPMMQIEHQDPDAVATAASLAALDASSTTKMAFLQRDSDGTIGTTEYSLTVADGLVAITQHGGSVDDVEVGTIMIHPASSDGLTHPWTVGA